MQNQKPVYRFYSNCVGWKSDDVHADGGLVDLINDAVHITRETFLKYVDRNELRNIEEELGYESHPSRGLTMAGDYHVSYHRSKHHGQRVYFFKHSAIEFVFKRSN